jgi:hypothetical protein
MNIRYNAVAGRFEAERYATVDVPAIKAAGFKTEGPPTWVWHTNRVPVVEKLRADKPPSGLTIDDDARVMYTTLKESFDRNSAIKAEARKLSLTQKKEEKQVAQALPQPADDCPMDGTLPPCLFEGRELKRPGYLSSAYVPPAHPGPWCVMCKDPVYFYEMLAPWPICLSCEKELEPQNSA